jgi:transposase
MSDKLEIKLLGALAEGDRTRGMTAPEIAKAAGRKCSTIYPALERLEKQRGQIESRFEGDRFPSEGGKDTPAQPGAEPRMCYYRLTPA